MGTVSRRTVSPALANSSRPARNAALSTFAAKRAVSAALSSGLTVVHIGRAIPNPTSPRGTLLPVFVRQDSIFPGPNAKKSDLPTGCSPTSWSVTLRARARCLQYFWGFGWIQLMLPSAQMLRKSTYLVRISYTSWNSSKFAWMVQKSLTKSSKTNECCKIQMRRYRKNGKADKWFVQR